MNQYLKDKQYKIPQEVLKSINVALISNPNNDGIKRAKYLLKNGSITYQEMKRLKNFLDNFNTTPENQMQYYLAGGDLMKSFIDRTLNADRNAVKQSKEVKQMYDVDPMLGTKPTQTPRLNEDKKELKKNAVAVIVDSDNKILLLKRSSKPNIWQPSKWALVGGEIEKGETPQQAIEREIKEETNLDINKFTKSFSIQKNPDSIEHVFACRYDGDPTDIRLNEENSNYGWYDIDEMKFLDIVPHLIEYITMVFKKDE
jgi:8-oxo-dGTP pyrophosphatase MutT (NUDIX family)